MPEDDLPDENAQLLLSYKQQRSTTKASISRIKNNLVQKKDTLTAIDLECWLEMLNSYIKNLMTYQTNIEKLDSGDTRRSELEELCVSTKSLIKSMMGGNRRESLANETISSFVPSANKLPSLKIPKFCGKYAEYRNFIALFNSLVHNEPAFTTIQKYNHLISCLTGDALRTVKAFQVNEENYQNALDRLAERFDNKCLIFQDHVNSLFDLRKIVKPSASALRQIVDDVSAILDSLSHLGTDKDIMHALVIHLVMGKVDNTSKMKWDERQEFKELPKWDVCASALIRRCQVLEVSEERKGANENYSGTQKSEKRNTRSSFACSRDTVENCFYCSLDGHLIENCSNFASLTVSQRFSFVKKNGMCINCLKKGHIVTKCNGPKCKICNKSHNAILHRYEANQNNLQRSLVNESSAVVHNAHALNANTGNSTNNAQVSSNIGTNYSNALSNITPGYSQANKSNAQCMHVSSNSHQMILATAVVLVKNKYSQYGLARALLDSCSQVNLITENFAQKLCLKRQQCTFSIGGVGDSNTPIKYEMSTFVKSRISNFKFFVDFCVVHSISGHQPQYAISKDKLPIPSNIVLADPFFDRPQKVDLLLGCEFYLDLLSVGQIKLGPSLPTLQKTLLGWIVSGRLSRDSGDNISKTCNIVTESKFSYGDFLEALVHRFWELEEIPKRSLLTEEQKLCEEHFVNNTHRMPNGRFQVKLPFKCDPSKLGSSYETAKRRFIALERRLSKNPELLKMYNDFMVEYLHLGHMSPAGDDVLRGPHYVIPHQCVLRPQSSTTKLRVVFDASCKTSTQTSLNDILMVGPKIQNDLFSILLRFRLHKYAITADVTKMYRQVSVSEDHRKFQLILWRMSSDQPIQIYKLNTVTYGTSSAPFSAVRCLKEIGTIFESVYPIGSSVIINDFYVDDLISGADSLEKLKQLKTETIEILASCGFNLAKWFSNHPAYNNENSEKDLDLDTSDVTRALGLIWSTKKDLFTFKLEENFSHLPTTKRNILSISSRLFDPLGLLSPIIIRAKVLLQELWKRQIEWDESIPQYLDSIWVNIKDTLSDTHKVVIPRFVDIDYSVNCEVHGFSDASNNAYGCCIYIRSEHSAGITCRLLTAKSKVALLKVKSLPRLELCAAHLLAKLWHIVAPLLPSFVKKATFWSDSEIVLHWLQNHPSSLSTFVGNRISEIQEWTATSFWYHVPSKDNPADIVSRGSDVDTLMSSIWFSGPDFLYLQPNEWPKNKHFDLSPELKSLEKKKSATVMVISDNSKNPLFEFINRFSSYTKILRVFAYVLRAVMKFKGKTVNLNSSVFTPKELNMSFLKIAQILQNVEFSDELKVIRKGLHLKSGIHNLSPFIHEFDDHGISFALLRVGGRLLNAPIKEETKFPLLLKKGSHFIKVYLEHLHKTNSHAGPKILTALMRERIWLVNAREEARKIVRNCIICSRYKPKLLTQIMGNLPKDRLTAVRPFWICGVDLCGPVYTSTRIRGRPPIKTYIVVFVCFASKAVHLEAVSDLMTESFLSSLSRFVGRRGLPRKIWCDNATNFTGAANRLNPKFLEEKEQKRIKEALAEKGVEFQFIPPRAPHFGGLWEAAVKSAKHHLIRTVGNANLTFEELTTVLVDVEAILNSRPIVPISNDPCDGEALTPGHLLIGSSMKALPEPSLATGKLNCLKRFQLLSSLKERFWSAWQTDYVLQQQQKVKWAQESKNIEVGTMVTVHDDNIPPQMWLLGRIVAVEEGRDGRVRVAQVQTKNGIFKRPIHKLAPLPILDDSQTYHDMLQPVMSQQPCKGAGVK